MLVAGVGPWLRGVALRFRALSKLSSFRWGVLALLVGLGPTVVGLFPSGGALVEFFQLSVSKLSRVDSSDVHISPSPRGYLETFWSFLIHWPRIAVPLLLAPILLFVAVIIVERAWENWAYAEKPHRLLLIAATVVLGNAIGLAALGTLGLIGAGAL